MLTQHFLPWFESFQQQAVTQNERRLIALVGDETWALSLLNSLPEFPSADKASKAAHVNFTENKRWLIYSKSSIIPANFNTKRFLDKLGTENDYVVFVDENFNADALAALSGTLVAGGILFLIFAEQPSTERSNFQQRFFRYITDERYHQAHQIIYQHKLFTAPLTKTSESLTTVNKLSALNYQCATLEQVQAVDAIVKVVSGHRKRPLVLTADRGRGKSSALAIACANILLAEQRKTNNTQLQRIVITAPDVQSLKVFFHQLQLSLPTADLHQYKLAYASGSVEFIPVDQLLTGTIESPSLVLVDEAAAIPVYLLSKLLTRFHRMVFASTVHGYEGAGRGFTLKFKQILQKKCPQWRSLHIKQPIRWRENDPLEALIFDICLLNADLPDVSYGEVIPAHVVCKRVMVAELLQDEVLLVQVFSVLVTAHYQTKPSDLMILLDNASTHLLVAFADKKQLKVVGVVLLMAEGLVSNTAVCASDIDAVINSQRRLKNQFLPQALLTYCGITQAFEFSYFRIMRIAVHVELQQQNIGSFLLDEVSKYAKVNGVDFVGSSFGANTQLMRFWLNNHFQIIRLGFTLDKASGEHSALMLKALKGENTQQVTAMNNEFYRSFDYLLTDEYNNLSTDLIALIQSYVSSEKIPRLTDSDLHSIQSFVQGNSLYSSSAFSLYLWLKHHLVKEYHSHNCLSGELKEQQQFVEVLIARMMQKHSISDVCLKYGYSGKKTLNSAIRQYIAQFI